MRRQRSDADIPDSNLRAAINELGTITLSNNPLVSGRAASEFYGELLGAFERAGFPLDPIYDEHHARRLEQTTCGHVNAVAVIAAV